MSTDTMCIILKLSLLLSLTLTKPLIPHPFIPFPLPSLLVPSPLPQNTQTIKMKEEGNPLYSFLFAPDSPNGLYYRWRTYGTCWTDKLPVWQIVICNVYVHRVSTVNAHTHMHFMKTHCDTLAARTTHIL